MNSEPLLLTLLFAVAAVGAIGAINARDTVRMVVSSLLAMFCLATAVYHTSRYLTLKEVPPPPVAAPEPMKPPPPPPGPDTVGLGASKREAILAQGKAELRGVLDQARRLQGNLTAFDLSRVSEVSDDEYQQMQSHAQAYSAEAVKLQTLTNETIAKLPAGLEDAAEAMNTAVGSMVASAHNLERFFKSENDSEEKERLANFRHGAQAAEAALRKAEIRLGSGGAAP